MSGKIYVTGDRGEDLFTRSDKGGRPTTHSAADTAYDFPVPRGAPFLHHVLEQLLPEASIVDDRGKEGDEEIESLQGMLTHIKQFGKKTYRVWHIDQLKKPGPSKQRLAKAELPVSPGDLLIIHYGGAAWKTIAFDGFGTFLDQLKADTKPGGNAVPAILVNVKALPELLPNGGPCWKFRSPLWRTLSEHDSNVGIVIAMSTLRRGGAAISLGFSWERTIEDFAAERHLFPQLQALGRFRHLFVRLGVAGLIHIEQVANANCSHRGRLYFIPDTLEAFQRDPEVEGRVIGKNSLLIASLVQAWKSYKPPDGEEPPLPSDREEPPLRAAFGRAIRAIREFHDGGYSAKVLEKLDEYLKDERDRPGRELIKNFLQETKKKFFKNSAEDIAAEQQLIESLKEIERCFKPPPDGSKLEGCLKKVEEFFARSNADADAGADLIEQSVKKIERFNASQADTDGGKADTDPNKKADTDPGKNAIQSLQKIIEKHAAEVRCSDIGIPQYLMAPPLPNALRSAKRWHMLHDALHHAPVHRVNIATAIVIAGHKKILNKSLTKEALGNDLWEILNRADYWNPHDRAPDYMTLVEGEHPSPPVLERQDLPSIPVGRPKQHFQLVAPVFQFGKLFVADREEIEGLCSVSRLLKDYVRDKEHNRKPISIAVFGPPGTGKSFAIKRIAETFDRNEKVENLEFNVAQFKDVNDLGLVLTKVGSLNHQQVTPLVFFDEFDCVLDKQPLGWLKYFLAPMQDGSFYDANQTIDIGRAIFVFAGGTFASFERFDPRTIALPSEELGLEFSREHKDRVKAFAERKGPDFISRLRGHINISQINNASGNVKHLIRRALVLRSMIEMQHYCHPRNAPDGVAMIDEEVIYALLTVDRYRHGVRSMEAILQMCKPVDGRIHIASLPSPAQLSMHVDAEEFLIRLYRGRARKIRPQ
jgi:hypothetical protein